MLMRSISFIPWGAEDRPRTSDGTGHYGDCDSIWSQRCRCAGAEIQRRAEASVCQADDRVVGDALFLQLSHQVSEAASAHRQAMKEMKSEHSDNLQENEEPTDGEFLSGFWKTDRLIPVVTLVIYFGSDSWDAPLSLREMYSGTDNVILAHAPDYHVNLIAPREMSDDEINEFHSNLREVMLYIKYSKDKKTLNKVVKEDIKFQSMERQAAEVINVPFI